MENRQCDVDDILCQIEALRSMRTLRSVLTGEVFEREFPELEGLDAKLLGKIQAAKGNIREALEKCGNVDLEDEIPDLEEFEEEE